MGNRYSVAMPITIDISDSATISDAVDIRDMQIKAIKCPASLTGTSFTLKIGMAHGGGRQIAADKPATFYDVVDEAGAAVTITHQADKVVVLLPSGIEYAALDAAHWVQFVSNGSEIADRTFYLIGHKV